MLLAFLGGVSSCLYDSANRCDAGQKYNSESGLCVCDEALNLIAGDRGCVACAEHEVAANDACGCEPGYSRPSSGAACQVVPKALGGACQSDEGCQDAVFNTCHLVGDGSGYCTNACASSDECSGGYACNTNAAPSYCQRPPDGAGKSCGSTADCAGTAATYCESFNTHACYVEGCSLTSNDCFPGKECCDLGPLSGGIIKKQICVDSGTCGKK